MKPEGDGLRIARYVNVGVWFWLLVSDVLHRVVTTGDFWDEKLRQAFSLNRDILNAPQQHHGNDGGGKRRASLIVHCLLWGVHLLKPQSFYKGTAHRPLSTQHVAQICSV